jgi:hypothetical protein
LSIKKFLRISRYIGNKRGAFSLFCQNSNLQLLISGEEAPSVGSLLCWKFAAD